MGSISSKGSEDKASQKNKELDNMFQFLQKDIISSLQQLLFCNIDLLCIETHWYKGSLAEVRGCYEKFRRSGRQAYIDRTEFSKLMPFTKTNSFFIFGNLVKKDAGVQYPFQSKNWLLSSQVTVGVRANNNFDHNSVCGYWEQA